MPPKKRLHLIDLFAGCGGLSLGLEQAGFQPVFVNELNDDARSTYLANREHSNPRLLQPDFHNGDIKQLVLAKSALDSLCRKLSSTFGIDPRDGELDLVAGGPPCQGFSGIGHRRSYSVDREQMPSNMLYEDMVYVISKLQPKAFLFENVKGLLSARWTRDGEKGEIWNDVLTAFNLELGANYEIEWSLVHAKEYGVPQNRPRVLMVGLRKDLAKSFRFSETARARGLLPEPNSLAPNLIDVLGDLVDDRYMTGKIASTDSYPKEATTELQRYFRTDPVSREIRKKGAPISEHEYSRHAPRIVRKFQYMLDHDGAIPASLRTRKFAQRLLPTRWGKGGPSITATSLPDDYVHFSQPRSLTVREWARLQTFPDWYCFRGKRTTGGMRRAGNPRAGIFERELPKYTQIGNAVPVLLANAIGNHLAKILRQC